MWTMTWPIVVRRGTPLAIAMCMLTSEARAQDAERVRSAIQVGQPNLRVRGRTASTHRRVRMTLRATVAIERRSQARAGFS